MKAGELEYDLPPELIAQHPAERRDHSRLLVYERETGSTRHRRFDELPEELPAGTLVVVNDTRVLPARLRLARPGGGEAEVLLLERLGENGTWEGLARPSRKLRPGQRLGPVELLEPLGEGSPIAKFLEKNPDGGMHHICYEVDDIIAARDRLVNSGARVLGSGEPKIGAHGKPVLFLHPKDFNGTLVELEQA